MKEKHLANLLIVLLIAHLGAYHSAPARAAVENSSPSLRPEGLYNQAWSTINDTYYDATFNGQDWNYWRHKFDGTLKTYDDAHKAIETMLASLGDRYTRFLNKSAFEDETAQIQAKLEGIGVQIGLDHAQRIVVIAPIEGTPAAESGMLAGDVITCVNGKSTAGMSIEEVSKLIRGPLGTQVTLKLQRGKETKEFKVMRAEIRVKSVQEVIMLNNDAGYIRLSTFISQAAADELRTALTQLAPARGIILDLRDNPGGLLANAVTICGMFLDGGIVVQVVDRAGNTEVAKCSGIPLSHQPLVVLINHGSASASEITSGALHDSGRAELVGQKSFGKGLVQKINRLDDGTGINVTIARYFTPNAIDINKKGIEPDDVIELTPEDYKKGLGPWWAIFGEVTPEKRSPVRSKDVQLQKAIDVLQAKIENRLPESLKIQLSPGRSVSPDGRICF